MRDEAKTKAVLIQELVALRRRISALEESRTKPRVDDTSLSYHHHTYLLQNISDAVITTDMDLRITSWNRAAETIYGWEAHEVVGQSLDELLKTEFLETDQEVAQKQLQSNKVWEGQIRQVRKDGETVKVLASVSLLEDRRGKPIGRITINRDITARKQAEQALQEAYQKLEERVVERTAELTKANEALRKLSRVVEQTADLVLITNRDGAIEYVNPAFEEETGYTKEEAVGQMTNLLKSGKHHESFYEEMWQTIRAGQVFRGVIINRKKSGQLYYEEKSITPLKNEQGEITHFVSTGKDITGRIEMEQALRQSEKRYRLLVENAPLGIVSIDSAGNIVDINDKFLELLDSPSPEFTRSVNVLTFPLIAATGISDDFRRCLETGELVINERWYVSHWGKKAYLRYHLTPILNSKQDLTGVQGVAEDFTERKQAEQKLQRYAKRLQALHRIDRAILTAQSPETVAEAALSHILELVSCTRASISVIDPQINEARTLATYVEGQVDFEKKELFPWNGPESELLSQSQIHLVQDIMSRPQKTAREQMMLAYGIRSYVDVALMVQDELVGLLNLGASEPERFSPDALDVANEVANSLAIAIRQAHLNEQTREYAKTKAVLLEEVNHRVKNNLAGIIGMLYVTRRYARQGNIQADNLTIIDDLIYRIEGLATVHRMLSASEWSPVDLSELTGQIIKSVLNSLPPGKRIQFSVNSTTAIKVGPKQANSLAMIINELTTNAVKYGLVKHQSGRINVYILLESNFILFRFRDNGPGFPEDVLGLKRHNVGLYLIRNLVNGLQGELKLRNDNGAVTIIRFPMVVGGQVNDLQFGLP